MKPRCALLLCFLFTRSGAAESAPLHASLKCAKATSPGRILCELATRATVGKLVWSDALVVHAPLFARPLRARLSAKLGAAPDPETAFSRFALVASGLGRGNIELLTRGVVCKASAGAESCSPEVLSVTAVVEVGP